MRISVVTDEVSADPETAFELGREWGVVDYEIRGFFTERAPLLSAYQKHRLREMTAEYGARIVAISPGLFKLPLPVGEPEASSLGWMERGFFDGWAASKEALRFHLDELLPTSIDYAGELGARLIICFGFHRGGLPPGPAPVGVLDALAQAADRAGAAGLTLAVETEEGFWADTGARTAGMLRAIGHPALGVNWDPANAFAAGDRPFPDGYAAVRRFVRNVHFKDARLEPDGAVRFVVDGEIDWSGQIDALRRDGYDGCVAVETHVRPRVAAARHSVERLKRFLNPGIEQHEPVNPRR